MGIAQSLVLSFTFVVCLGVWGFALLLPNTLVHEKRILGILLLVK
jgi:hypothetical protein